MLKEPFAVIATQNPDDMAGTYPLPDSQLDRFLLRTAVGYPAAEVEKRILATRGGAEPVDSIQSAVTLAQLVEAQREVDAVTVDESVIDYAYSIVHATRTHDGVAQGVSTRGALAFLKATRARAIMMGRSYVIPDDISELAVPVLAHRLRVAGVDMGAGSGWTADGRRDDAARIVHEILQRVDVPL